MNLDLNGEIKHAGTGHPCFLKTGTKDGPSKGKSYYICGKGQNVQCNFVRPVDLPASLCLVHPGNLIELQAFSTKISPTGEARQYFRCQRLKAEGKNGWCGHKAVKIKMNLTRKPLHDVNGARNQAVETRKNYGPSHRGPGNEQEDSQLRHAGNEKISSSCKSEDTRSTSIPDKMKQAHLSEKKSNEKLQERVQSTHHSHKNEKDSSSSSVNQVLPKRDKMPSEDDDCFIIDDDEEEDLAIPGQQRILPGSRDQGEDTARNVGAQGSANQKTEKNNKSSPRNHNAKKHEDDDPSKQISVREAEDSENALVEKLSKVKLQDAGGQTMTAASGLTINVHHEQRVNNATVPQTTPVPQPRAVGASQPVGQSIPPATQTSVTEGVAGGPGSGQGQVVFVNAQGQVIGQDIGTVRQNLLRQLAMHQRTLNTVPIAALPDRGEKLKAKIRELENAIKQLNKYAAQQNGTQQGQPKITSFTQSGLSMKEQLYQAMKASLPSGTSAYQYAAQPQMNSLYGGRMTASRQREVSAVTKDAISKLHKQLESCPAPDEATSDPHGLKVSLMQHQKQALTWLIWREGQHPCGGILADDMGLGKTLTMISLILKQKQLDEEKEDEDVFKADEEESKDELDFIKSKTTLVICPASLLDQWEKEVSRRCRAGLLTVYLYHGPKRAQHPKYLTKHDIVLTTYQIVSRELEAAVKDDNADQAVEESKSKKLSDQPLLLQIGWDRVILDEGHNIKNHKSKSAVAISRLRARARWAMTGTPIQNNLMDMYSLLRFLRCSPFDEYQVWRRQVDQNKRSGNKWLSILVKSLLLRRTKDQVDSTGKPLVSLPAKNLTTHEVDLCPAERKLYDKLFQVSRGKVQEYINFHEDKSQGLIPSSASYSSSNAFSRHGRNESDGHLSSSASTAPSGKMNASYILVMLLRLRQCCTHPSLLKEIPDEDTLKQDDIELSLVGQMKELGLSEDLKDTSSKNGSPGPDLSVPTYTSTKIKSVLQFINEIKREDNSESGRSKCVVISQWTQMLDVMATHLKEANIRCLSIRGDVSQKKRNEAVEDFNNNPRGPRVMLVSLKAGGVGLNLIGGNHLFIMDMHWNPALEEQACDRIYRVGQRKDVHIHKFICKDTIEQRISDLQKKKTQLAKDVLSGSKEKRNKLSLNDLRLLFGLN